MFGRWWDNNTNILKKDFNIKKPIIVFRCDRRSPYEMFAGVSFGHSNCSLVYFPQEVKEINLENKANIKNLFPDRDDAIYILNGKKLFFASYADENEKIQVSLIELPEEMLEDLINKLRLEESSPGLQQWQFDKRKSKPLTQNEIDLIHQMVNQTLYIKTKAIYWQGKSPAPQYVSSHNFSSDTGAFFSTDPKVPPIFPTPYLGEYEKLVWLYVAEMSEGFQLSLSSAPTEIDIVKEVVTDYLPADKIIAAFLIERDYIEPDSIRAYRNGILFRIVSPIIYNNQYSNLDLRAQAEKEIADLLSEQEALGWMVAHPHQYEHDIEVAFATDKCDKIAYMKYMLKKDPFLFTRSHQDWGTIGNFCLYEAVSDGNVSMLEHVLKHWPASIPLDDSALGLAVNRENSNQLVILQRLMEYLKNSHQVGRHKKSVSCRRI